MESYQNALSKTPLKRKSFTFADKWKIIEAYHGKSSIQTKAEFAKEHGLPLSTLSTMLKNKDKIVNASCERKKLRKCAKDDIDSNLFLWFKDASAKNMPIDGALIKQTAESIAWSLGYQGWTCSAGWFFRWKVRHNLASKAPSIKRCKETVAEAKSEPFESWLTAEVTEILRAFTPEGIDQSDVDELLNFNFIQTPSTLIPDNAVEEPAQDPIPVILDESESSRKEAIETVPLSSAKNSLEILRSYFEERGNETGLSFCAELQNLIDQEQERTDTQTTVTTFSAT